MLINDDDREAFDEAQGLTIDMISEELTRRGWTTGAIASLEVMPSPGGLLWVAKCRGITLQALLREINPRMRQGMPSHAAIKAHDENMMKEGNDSGRWIAVRKCDKNAEVTVVRFVFGLSCVKVWFDTAKGTSDIRHEEGQWLFWPCDHKGNKVRWPTDDNGNML